MPEPAKTTTKCPDETNFYDNLPFCKGSVSLPGLRPHFYYLPKSSITTWPVMKTAAKMGDVAVYDQDFVLEADAKWKKVEMLNNKTHFESNTIGGEGNRHFENIAELKMPGTEEEVTGFIAQIINEDAVFLVPQRNGKIRVFGNESFKAELEATQNSGEGKDDENSSVLKVTVEDMFPAVFYPGKIETDDGDISGATGKLIVPEIP